MPSMPAGNLSDTAARGFAQASRLGPAPYFGRFVGSLGMQTGNYSSGACFASFFPKRGFREAAVLPVVYAGGKQRRRCAHPLGASASHEVEEGGRLAAGLRGRPPSQSFFSRRLVPSGPRPLRRPSWRPASAAAPLPPPCRSPLRARAAFWRRGRAALPCRRPRPCFARRAPLHGRAPARGIACLCNAPPHLAAPGAPLATPAV